LLSFHLYETPEPRHGKSSLVQKGLVPSLRGGGSDLCEEGLGVGVPILQYRRDFYFPGSSKISNPSEGLSVGWSKRFVFNLIERRQRLHRQVGALSWVLPRILNWIYKSRSGRWLLRLTPLIKTPLSLAFAWEQAPPTFFKVHPRGNAHTQYIQKTHGGKVFVTLDLNPQREGLQHIYICNELGGTLFTEYYDSEGVRLVGEDISPWAQVSGRWAIFGSKQLNLGFRVDFPKQGVVFRGREVIPAQHVFWSGIIFRLSPATTRVSYQVQLGSLKSLLEAVTRD
jgi:hypothetical protein